MEPNNELMNALQTLLEIGKYSDLTIKCGPRKWDVHKAIICSRSGFFDGACSGMFKEAQTGVIDLSEDDPEAVEHMVNYFYKLDYLNASRPSTPKRPSSPGWVPMAVEVIPNPMQRRSPPRKLNLAFVEDPLLATAAANSTPANALPPPLTSPVASPIASPINSPFHTDFSASIKSSLNNPYNPLTPLEELKTSPWDHQTTGSQECDHEASHLIVHAKVYALAEKYGIMGLKSLSRHKFASQIKQHVGSPELGLAMQEAYESTIDSDRGLRDIVIQTFRSNPDIARRTDIDDILRQTPGLVYELYKVGWNLPIVSRM